MVIGEVHAARCPLAQRSFSAKRDTSDETAAAVGD